MYQIYDDKGNVSKEFSSIEEAIQIYVEWKDSYISDEVDYDSSVELIYHDNISDDGITIRKATIIEDEERLAKDGLPSEHGYEWSFWAKWHEYSVAELMNEVNDKYTV